MPKIHGGHLIARALGREGVDTVFTLTGGHILPILDGCVQEGIRVVDVRHEQAAVHAAEAYGRLTGRLGVAAVTAGPGVTDSVTGIANAWFAGTPLLVLGGRHLLRQELKGGLQEMDHPPVLAGITAWARTAFQTERLAEYVATAARYAFAGRGGPVFLDVPMDVQFDEVDDGVLPWPEAHREGRAPGLDAATLDAVVEALRSSQRPMIFAGAGARGGGGNRLRELAEALQAPTYLNSRARGSLPYGHPLLGNHSRTAAFGGCDLILALGVDWDFRAGYGETVASDAVVIQVDAEPTRIGWNRSVHIGAVADPMTAVDQLADRAAELRHRPRPWVEEIMGQDAARQAALDAEADSDESPVMPQRFGRDVAEFFGTDSIVAVDGGDIVSTTARWLRISTPGHVLDPGPFGTLGTGAPFAIAAKLAHPDRTVGIVYGDGAFGFNGFEYDTMVRLGLPVIGVMGNDGVWANIKTIHKAFFPERVVAADLGVRPYHRVVAALGGHGERVEEPRDLLPALERARASGKPALVDVHLAETARASSNYGQ
jgi:acetolactate synthase I/II/III large subunit